MNFILIPAVLGICTFTLYKIIELGVRRRERLTLIDKLSSFSGDLNTLDLSKLMGSSESSGGRFISLRIGTLILGLGLGLLIGFLIIAAYNLLPNGENSWAIREINSIIYGSSTLLFGGLGLLCGFLIENSLRNRDK